MMKRVIFWGVCVLCVSGVVSSLLFWKENIRLRNDLDTMTVNYRRVLGVVRKQNLQESMNVLEAEMQQLDDMSDEPKFQQAFFEFNASLQQIKIFLDGPYADGDHELFLELVAAFMTASGHMNNVCAASDEFTLVQDEPNMNTAQVQIGRIWIALKPIYQMAKWLKAAVEEPTTDPPLIVRKEGFGMPKNAALTLWHQNAISAILMRNQ